MKILVTGAAGFLGFHLSAYFSKHKIVSNQELILCDIGHFQKSDYPTSDVTFVKADIRDKKTMEDVMRGVDVVIHAAAALPLWPTRDIFEINVEGTRNVLQTAYKNKVRSFIYISSTAVYGVPKKHPVYETDRLIGVGPYGKSKIAAEMLCNEYRKKGLVVTTIRPKTFLGTHRLGVFEILFDWIKDGKKIPVIGDGNNRYQLLEVDDLVHAIYLFAKLRGDKQINSVFNIGSAEFQTVKKDFNTVFKTVGSSSSVFPTPAVPVKTVLFILEKLRLSPLYQWIYNTADKDSYVSIDKLTQTLHWKPKYSNAEALIKAYKWYEKNYKDIKARPEGVTHTVGWSQGILSFFKKFL